MSAYDDLDDDIGSPLGYTPEEKVEPLHVPFDVGLVADHLDADDAPDQNIMLSAALLAGNINDDETQFLEQHIKRQSLGYFQRLYEEKMDVPALHMLSN